MAACVATCRLPIIIAAASQQMWMNGMVYNSYAIATLATIIHIHNNLLLVHLLHLRGECYDGGQCHCVRIFLTLNYNSIN